MLCQACKVLHDLEEGFWAAEGLRVTSHRLKQLLAALREPLVHDVCNLERLLLKDPATGVNNVWDVAFFLARNIAVQENWKATDEGLCNCAGPCRQQACSIQSAFCF
jgi:hypothetical protein